MEKANKFENIWRNKTNNNRLEPKVINKTILKLLAFDEEILSIFTRSGIQTESNLLKHVSAHIINQSETNNLSIIEINEQFTEKKTNQIIMTIAKTLN